MPQLPDQVVAQWYAVGAVDLLESLRAGAPVEQ
jgi:hypothetical protein